MIEMFAIFAALVLTPMLIAFPFCVYFNIKEAKEKEAQLIVNRLRGIPDNLNGWLDFS